MNSIKAREFLRTHVLGLVAIFIALSGTAIAAGDGPTASTSVVTNAKFKKLKQRVAALEAKPAPVIPTIPTSLPPSGPAGGNLSGSFPNPQIATGAVTGSKLGPIVTRTNSVALNAGTSNTVTATCNAGERIISGGGVVVFIGAVETVPITQSIKSGTAGSPGNGWTVSANNGTGVNLALVSQAYCLQ